MAQIYYELVKSNKRTIKQVPSNLVAEVKSLLDANGITY
jgi:hypothetical protein